MRSSPILIFFTVCAALGGCGKPSPVDENATGAKLPAPVVDRAPKPQGGPPSNQAEQPAAPSSAAASIPAALQGRWGLTPGDCTSTRGDAKGLMIVTSNELRFYESRAVPAAGIQANADSITGNFNYTGEGQSWTKFQSLELRKNFLVRTESNPAASYTYAKC